MNLPVVGAAGQIALSILNLGSGNLVNVELSALEADNRGKVVSSPRVITADKKKAVISQGTEIPYLTAAASGATTVSFKPAVLELAVTPRITPDDRIIMDLEVKKDSVGQIFANIPSIDTKKVNTQVLVDNGDTIVLGGIFEQTTRTTVDKVPFLGDMPFVGYLFKRTIEAGRQDRAPDLRDAEDREGRADDPVRRPSPRKAPVRRGFFFGGLAGYSGAEDARFRACEQRQHLPRRHDGRRQDHPRARRSRASWSCAFVDTDRVLVERTGVPVATIFEIEGEDGFRRRESAMLAELARAHGPRDRDRRRRRARRGEPARHARAAAPWCTCARAWRASGSARATTPAGRCSPPPIRAPPSPSSSSERDPLYREAAHLVVDTGSQSAATLVTRVVAALQRPARPGARA